MTNYGTLKKCPKCGAPGGLIKCPKCHIPDDTITIVFDGKAWKIWNEKETPVMGVIEHSGPERIVITPSDAADEMIGWALIAPDEQPVAGEVEYVRADLHRGAVEALRFYADESNWTAVNPPGRGAPAWHDHGGRARDALGGQ